MSDKDAWIERMLEAEKAGKLPMAGAICQMCLRILPGERERWVGRIENCKCGFSASREEIAQALFEDDDVPYYKRNSIELVRMD